MLIGGLIIFAAWYFFKDDEEKKDKVYVVELKEKKTELPVVRVEPIYQHFEGKIYTPNK